MNQQELLIEFPHSDHMSLIGEDVAEGMGDTQNKFRFSQMYKKVGNLNLKFNTTYIAAS